MMTDHDDNAGPLRVAVVTGSRAEFGLLTPVMEAVRAEAGLELQVIAAGSHLVQPALTFRDVRARFEVADTVPMQVAGRTGRFADVEAVARGVARFGRSFERLGPEGVVVLGDRIEAFAAASAASIGGIAVAHLHGGDVAEGVADESMRHAITKLSHLHLAATRASARRIRLMGERAETIRVVGSPALDGLGSIPEAGDAAWAEAGEPEVLLLWHPIGSCEDAERDRASRVLAALEGRRVLALHPNLDPGRHGVLSALRNAGEGVRVVEHVPRAAFIGLVRRLARTGGVLAGNSSAGLIEAPALGCATIDIGPRQSGREAPASVRRVESIEIDAVRAAVDAALGSGPVEPSTLYGGGDAGPRAAGALREAGRLGAAGVRKRYADPDADGGPAHGPGAG